MAQTSGSHSKALYILMTSLFYPAVLGVIFYSILESFAQLSAKANTALLLVAYGGILISFSFDFLYTFVSRSYPVTLFVSDIAVLVLLVVGYSSLINALGKSTTPKVFLLCYSLIHLIFVIWDLTLIPKKEVRWLIVCYDISGLVVSSLIYLLVPDSVPAALATLWVLTVFYAVIGIKAILPQLDRAPEVDSVS